MKRKKVMSRLALTVVLSAGLVGGSAVAANAEPAGGGDFQYGVTGFMGTNYSHYLHNSYFHRATAQDGNGYKVHDRREAGIWARASQQATASGNKAFWNHNYGSRNIG